MLKRIGFLGPKGTFTEEALEKWLNRQNLNLDNWEKEAFPSISELMYAIGKDTDVAVVPAENSLEGSVNITIDLLIHEIKANIIGEVILPIKQNLFACKNVSLKDIEVIYSHPQAIFQCRDYLKKKLPKVKFLETSSTAGAARLVSERGGNTAAIGSIRLGKNFGLQLLAKNIQGTKNNKTRFYVISAEDLPTSADGKTTLAFSMENKPGSLANSLKLFANRGINLTKIESRPSKRMLGEYIFFIEFEGTKGTKAIDNTLRELKSVASFYKFLGSYPID